MRTSKLELKNPSRSDTYGESKTHVSASVAISIACDSPADQVRAILALDAIWVALATRLHTFNDRDPSPESLATADADAPEATI